MMQGCGRLLHCTFSVVNVCGLNVLPELCMKPVSILNNLISLTPFENRFYFH